LAFLQKIIKTRKSKFRVVSAKRIAMRPTVTHMDSMLAHDYARTECVVDCSIGPPCILFIAFCFSFRFVLLSFLKF